MAKKASHPYLNIDLLHPAGSQPKLYVQIFRWMLSSGRYIVIIVELVVIGAFVSRFKLDSDLTNIQDRIKEQVPYIRSLKNDEALIRQTQFQLATVKQIRSEAPQWNLLMAKVASLTPVNTKLTNVNFDRTQDFPKTYIAITGLASSNTELAAFLKAIQSDPTFKDVVLTNLSYDRQYVIFTISGTIAITGADQGKKS